MSAEDVLSTVEEGMQPRLYLCGPMNSYPDNNFPEFIRVSGLLRKYGYTVVSPHEVPCSNGSTSGGSASWEDYLRSDIVAMMQGTDALATLPQLDGYAPSRGMKVEIGLATSLGWQVKPYAEWLRQVWFVELKSGQMLPARVPVPTKD